MLDVIHIPVLSDNYTYLIICKQTGEAACVDAPDAPAVRSAVKELGVSLTTVFNTHHHWDHVGGNEDLLAHEPKLRIYGGEVDRDRIPGLTDPLAEGDLATVGRLQFRILFIPGHTKGHIAYVGYDRVFCGDTLFVGGCGRLFEGTAGQMIHSLNKLKSLPDCTQVYCGHEYTEKNLRFALTIEPDNDALKQKYAWTLRQREHNLPTVPSRIAEEMEYNPFLRCRDIAEFTVRRQLKDQF